MKIAILGAESTGKSELTGALVECALGRGCTAAAVPEYLREWCDRHGRTPVASEQWHIAQTQAQRVSQAAAADWLIVDTTPLMTAIYSDYLFGDISLYEPALEHQRQYNLTLVTALDLPWVADGLQRDGAHVRQPIDALLRTTLQRAGIAYQEVRGIGNERLRCALRAIEGSMNAD